MFFTKDMKDLLSIFKRHKVQYALVGGFAVNFYGYVRMTQDVDILIYPSVKNARNVMEALGEFGFGKAGIPQKYFETAGSAIHLGVEPNRIDLLTRLKGVDNDTIFTHIRKIEFEGILIPIISYNDLIRSKRSSNRKRDLADAEELEKINTQRWKLKEKPER
jgi:hypothetical protein